MNHANNGAGSGIDDWITADNILLKIRKILKPFEKLLSVVLPGLRAAWFGFKKMEYYTTT